MRESNTPAVGRQMTSVGCGDRKGFRRMEEGTEEKKSKTARRGGGGGGGAG